MFTIDNVSTMPGNSNKYLEVLFATRGSIRGFIRSLKRQRTGRQNNIYLIPNIGGPICLKRAMLASVVHSMLLYGAPICERTLKVKKNRRCCKAPTRRFCCNFSGYNRDPVPRPNDAGEKADEWRNGQGNYKTLKRQNSAYLAGKMTRLYGHRGVEWKTDSWPQVLDWEHRTIDYYLTQDKHCKRWDAITQRTISKLGRAITPRNLVGTILECKKH